MERIRNFSIIAHVDHGKSTLADRFIQICGGLEAREMQDQVLDSLELERERGITIKAQSVTLYYTSKRDGERYQLNLIDTPGHVDFSYEVSRSLAACDGALLVVDSTQGVEAQSVANCYTATELGLEVVPVINKIDLPSADPARVVKEIEAVIGIHAEDALKVSGKTGEGVEELIEQLIERIPAPKGDAAAPLQALIIDSWFDNYVGVVTLVRVVNGSIKAGDKMRVMSTGRATWSTRSAASRRSRCRRASSARRRGLRDRGHQGESTARRSATPSRSSTSRRRAAAGFQAGAAARVRRHVPDRPTTTTSSATRCRSCASTTRRCTTSPKCPRALGLRLPRRLPRPAAHGHRAGAPRARIPDRADHQRADRGLRGAKTDGDVRSSTTRPNYRRRQDRELREPIIVANILVPPDHVGGVLQLCADKRGVQKKMLYLGTQVSLQYELPLAEVVLDFFDRLKSTSRGYASFDYDFSHFQTAPLVKLDVLINGDKVDALALIVHKDSALRARPRPGRQDAGADPAADVRGGRAGRDRQPYHRPRHREGAAQERAREVLRRLTSRARRSCSRSRKRARSA
jgi:GTP-binding protein LepA